MNIGDKMHDTLTNLEVAALNMKTYAIFGDLSEKLDGICKTFEERMNSIEEKNVNDL